MVKFKGLVAKKNGEMPMLLTKENDLSNFTYVALGIMVLLSAFNGIVAYKVGTFPVILLKAILCTLIFIVEKASLSKKVAIFFLSYVMITFIYFFIFNINAHYDSWYNFKNVIISMMDVYCVIALFLVFRNKLCGKPFIVIMGLLLGLETVFYFLYLKGYSFESRYLLKDWTGRFKGTFSEPSKLGFLIGILIFTILILFKSKLRLIIVAGLVYVLFTACKSKFPLLAIPLSLFISIPIGKRIDLNIKGKKYLFYSVVVILAVTYIIVALFSPSVIFSAIYNSVGSNMSFTTRFFFPVASARQFALFPFGTGYGNSLEYYVRQFENLAPLMEKCHLDISELKEYSMSGPSMSANDTISYLTCSFGITGLLLYFSEIGKIIEQKYIRGNYVRGIVIFVLLESVFTKQIFAMDDAFIFVVFALCVINSCKKENFSV